MEFGFWSVVPPLLTIVLALVTKNVFVSLLLGILCGSMVHVRRRYLQRRQRSFL